MAGTSAGNKKIARRLKEKYGVDESGKSLFHVKIGSAGGKHSGGYFRNLVSTDPDRLVDISRKGGTTKRKNRT